MDTSALAHSHDAHGDAHGHEPLPWWQRYLFSTDHKVIGIQYGLTGLTFLLFGFCLMLVMRWQLAMPGQAVPGIGGILQAIFGSAAFANDPQGQAGMLTADGYNSFGAMHGTMMIFFGVVPVGFAAFANYLVPLQIGAPDMCFPRLNMASYWCFFVSCVIMVLSFFVPGGGAKSGWTSYPPLANIADMAPGQSLWWNGQTLWLIGLVFNITGSLLGSVNVIATIIQLRAPGMTWMRLPFFVWAQFVTAFLLLLAFPPLEAAGFMQLMDRVAGTSFFMPTGLMLNQAVAQTWAGGGHPLLWQHLFWFLGHPEVYVLLLPGLSMVAEIIANNTRKPLYGYKAMVIAVLMLGFLSMLVWAHHMYMTGMGAKVSAFFQTTTTLVSIPSVVLLTCLLLSLWGGSIRFTVPMLFASAFLPMFGIGGLTGIPLAFNATDAYLHDTYYIIGHFHYVVAPGVIMALFAGVYYWYPKATGRQMNNFLGHVHFWISLIALNGIFFPMLLQGMAGVHRRWYDGGVAYEQLGGPVIHWNSFMSNSAYLLALGQLPFIFNFFWSMWRGKPAGRNPWDATTLEWQTPTPPPHGNFDMPIAVFRGPYEYSCPGCTEDYLPQNTPPQPRAPHAEATPVGGQQQPA
jgi:cytochrome c oxidase subunit 1